jgi:hypothetical protein
MHLLSTVLIKREVPVTWASSPCKRFSFFGGRSSQESKLAARGIKRFATARRRSNKRALRFGLDRSGLERQSTVKVARHGLEAHVTETLLCAFSAAFSGWR